MLKSVFNRILFGIGLGCTEFVVMLFSVSLFAGDVTGILGRGTPTELMQTAGAMVLVTLGFTLPSVIYEKSGVALIWQIVIHMALGMLVFCLTSYFAGWMPRNGLGGVASYIGMALFFALCIWGISYFFMKREAKRMNEKLRQKR